MVLGIGSVLNPLGTRAQGGQAQKPAYVENLAGKTIGFLSTFWPTYEPLVEGLGKLLQEKVGVGATPRLDYGRRPLLNEVWKEHQDWIESLDGAIVGIGA